MKGVWPKEFWKVETIADCYPNAQRDLTSALQGGSDSKARPLRAFRAG